MGDIGRKNIICQIEWEHHLQIDHHNLTVCLCGPVELLVIFSFPFLIVSEFELSGVTELRSTL